MRPRIRWAELTTAQVLYVLTHVDDPLAVMADLPGARVRAAAQLGSPDRWEVQE